MNKYLKRYVLPIIIGLGLTASVAVAGTIGGIRVNQGGTGNVTISQGSILAGSSTNNSLVEIATGSQGSLLWMGSNGMPAWTATSTLGISAGVGLSSLNGQTGSTQTFATNTTATGLNLNITSATNTHTWALSLQSGYTIPLSASTTEWTTAYNWGNHASAGYLTTATAASTYVPFAYASSTFPSFTYASGTFQTTLTTGNLTANSPLSFNNTRQVIGGAAAISLDTSGTWTGNAGTATALAANGSNCSAGNSPLGVDASGVAESCFDVWTESENTSAGYLSSATAASTYLSFPYASSTFPSFTYASSSYALINGTPTFSKVTTTNASTSALTASGNVYLTGLTSQPCIGTSAAGLLQAGTCTGGSGNSAWTIGNGLIYNATSTDSVLIGTSTPTTATMYLQGSGTKLPLTIASSTGSTLLTVAGSGLLTLYGPGLALDGATGAVYFSSAGGNMYQSWTNGLYMSVNGAYKGVWNQYGLTINNGANVAGSGVSLSVMNGNVGIGTSTPQAVLNVVGSSTFPSLVVASSSNATLFSVTSAAQILVCATCRLTIPQGTNPTLSASGDTGVDTTSGQFLYQTGNDIIARPSSSLMSIVDEGIVGAKNKRIAFRATVPITLVPYITCTNANNTDSVTFNMFWDSSVATATSSATAMFSSYQSCTSTTTGTSLTTLANTAIPAGTVIWTDYGPSSSSSLVNITIPFKYDRQ